MRSAGQSLSPSVAAAARRAVRWWLVCLVGVVAIALVVTMAPVPAAAAPAPEPQPQPLPSSGESSAWVEPTGVGVVRPDWLSASVTARASGQRVEVLAARTSKGRSWVLPSGLVESELTGEVRFKDPTKQDNDGWRDIDTTLLVAADGSVAPVAVPGSLRLSGGGDETALVSYTNKSGRSVQLGSGLPGVRLPKPVLDGSTAVYADVLPGVDIRVEARVSGFEQLWVIKDRAGLERFVAARGDGNEVALAAPFTVGKASVSPARDGSLELVDDKDRVVGELQSPTMWDGKVDPRSGRPAEVKPVAFALSAAGVDVSPTDPAKTGKLALGVRADRAWLVDPAREFPVTIDPTYEDGSSQVSFDTSVASNDSSDRSAAGELYRNISQNQRRSWTRTSRGTNFARGHEIHRRTANKLSRWGGNYNTSRHPDFRFGRGRTRYGVELKSRGGCRNMGHCVTYNSPRRGWGR